MQDVRYTLLNNISLSLIFVIWNILWRQSMPIGYLNHSLWYDASRKWSIFFRKKFTIYCLHERYHKFYRTQQRIEIGDEVISESTVSPAPVSQSSNNNWYLTPSVQHRILKERNQAATMSETLSRKTTYQCFPLLNALDWKNCGGRGAANCWCQW